MAGNGKPAVLVVVQLTGGNDFMNTVVPYSSPVYRDARPKIGVGEDDVLPIDENLGFNANASPLKDLYDRGKVAVIQGVGYPNSSRSHFRGMDIWHTCDTEKVSTEGWLGKAIRELDPGGENVLTGVNIGRGLSRAMAAPGVAVTSVGDVSSYGVMTGMEKRERDEALEIFKQMYAPAIGTGPVMDYLSQTGMDVLRGEDQLKKAPANYSSDVEYAADNPIAKSLRDVAMVHLADLGTRVFYTAHGGYDTHAAQAAMHEKLLKDLSSAVADFFADLDAHNASDEVAMMVFTEFGRRMRDNGVGTDHGSGGGAFLIGERIEGGLYGEYPPLAPDQWLNGEDLRHTNDFRGLYATVLEQWLEIDAVPIVGGAFEQLHPFK